VSDEATTPETVDPETGVEPLDLERIERDLAGVEAALRRLDDGTYWTDEVTGEPILDDVLAADPVTRRSE
jgi:RNA polymerase-binding transcription factor DksA